jgi:hypothetical protein
MSLFPGIRTASILLSIGILIFSGTTRLPPARLCPFRSLCKEGRQIVFYNSHTSGDGDVAVFQWLPHDLEDVAPEFRQFVQKQDSITATLAGHQERDGGFDRNGGCE